MLKNFYIKKIAPQFVLVGSLLLAVLIPSFLYLSTDRTQSVSNIKIELTPERKAELQMELTKSLNRVRGGKDILLGVFIYTENYTKRSTFVTTSPLAANSEVIDISNDTGYGEALEYHLEHVCFTRWTIDLDKNSKLFSSISKTGYTTPLSKYLACPIIIDNTLIGYVGTVYNEGEFKGLTPIIILNMQYITKVFGKILRQYV